MFQVQALFGGLGIFFPSLRGSEGWWSSLWELIIPKLFLLCRGPSIQQLNRIAQGQRLISSRAGGLTNNPSCPSQPPIQYLVPRSNGKKKEEFFLLESFQEMVMRVSGLSKFQKTL